MSKTRAPEVGGAPERELIPRSELEELIETGEDPGVAEMREHIVECIGISSAVFGGGDRLGHVMLLDYDDDVSFPHDPDKAHLDRYERILDEVDRLDGISAVFRSSPGSYHVWSLSVGSLGGRCLRALRTHSDPMHTAVSLRRGMFVLRYGPKVRTETIEEEQPEIYKEAPELLEVRTNYETTTPQSRPHYEMLETLAEVHDVELDVDLKRLQWLGDPDDLGRTRYYSVDDQLKAELW